MNISSVEVDHKDGHRDDYENLKPENQTLEDFQPLSPAVNKAKRQHCKVCRETKQRFDATVLGFSKCAWAGNGKYRGTCVGCYWHNVKKFNQEISKIKDNEGNKYVIASKKVDNQFYFTSKFKKTKCKRLKS